MVEFAFAFLIQIRSKFFKLVTTAVEPLSAVASMQSMMMLLQLTPGANLVVLDGFEVATGSGNLSKIRLQGTGGHLPAWRHGLTFFVA